MRSSLNSSHMGTDIAKLSLSKIITYSISLANVMLLARFRSLAEYGTYSQLLLTVNLFTSFLMLGLPSSINYFLARADAEEEKRKFLSIYYTINSILSLFTGLILVLSIPVIEEYFHNTTISQFYYFLALYPWTVIICSSVENLLVVYGKTTLLVRYRILHSIVMLGIVVLVQTLGFGFDVYMFIYVLVNCLFAVAVYIIANNISNGIKLFLDISYLKKILVFSVPLGLSSVVGTLNTEIDKLLIGKMMSINDMAIYTNAAKELPITIIPAAFTAVLLPKMASLIKHNKPKEAVSLWKDATALAFIFISLLVFGIFVFAEDVIVLLYSEKYIQGVSVFRVYTLNLLMRVTYFGIILNSYGDTKSILRCSILSLVLNLVLNPVFYKFFGMIGPAFATLLAILIVMLLQLYLTAIKTDVSMRYIMPWKNFACIIIINIVFGTIFYQVKQLLPLDRYIGSIMESILLGALWSIIYLIIIYRNAKKKWIRLNTFNG